MADIDCINELICQVIICQSLPHRSSSVSPVSASAFSALLPRALAVLRSEPAVLRLRGRFIVVGDLHGNLDDLLRIFQRHRYPPSASYLFLGDYVDRGKFSVEVVVLLLALKAKFPDRVFLLMGNHESRRMLSGNAALREECAAKISGDAFDGLRRAFELLPRAAVVNGRVLCVHGGISRHLSDLSRVRKAPGDRAEQRGAAEMLWNDPDSGVDEFAASGRNIGERFGARPLARFLERHGLQRMVRAHEFVARGFRWDLDGLCLTVFSSSNYQKMRNLAAVALIGEDAEVTTETIAPLREECICMRRRTFPSWLLEGQPRKKSFIDPVCSKGILI